MERIKIKDSLYLLKETGKIYQVGFTATRKIKRIKVDSLSKDLLNFILEEQSLLQVKDLMQSQGYTLHHINSALTSLSSLGIIDIFDKSDINERNKCQLYFINELSSSWNEAIGLQKKVEDCRIIVFGTGGIGTWIVNALYQMGVKNVTINDPDTIEESNVNRQLYFTSDNIGMYKVDVLKEKLSDCNIKTHKRYVSEKEDLEDIIANQDFIVNCTDQPSVHETTKIISQYAEKLKIAYSFAGGYNMHLGMLGSIFVPDKTVCYDCFLEYQKQNNPYLGLEVIREPRGSGNLGPMAGIIANLHVMDIFKYLTGKGTFNKNRYAEIDFMNLDIHWMEYASQSYCKKCC